MALAPCLVYQDSSMSFRPLRPQACSSLAKRTPVKAAPSSTKGPLEVSPSISPKASQKQSVVAKTWRVAGSLLFLAVLPATVQAQFEFATNNCAITITKYTGPGGAVVVPSETNGLPVTAIGTNAFELCFSMASVAIPNSITNIGASAVEGSLLTSVTIPDSVSGMGSNAFGSSYYLQSVTIGTNLGSIESYTFQFCPNLISVTLGSGVTNIGDYAFWSCRGLRGITISDNVTTIGDSAFRSCASLANITIGTNVTSIGDLTFYECSSLLRLTIPSGTISVGDYAFSSCSGLTNVAIGTNVATIGISAFDWCTSLSGVASQTTLPALDRARFLSAPVLATLQ